MIVPRDLGQELSVTWLENELLQRFPLQLLVVGSQFFYLTLNDLPVKSQKLHFKEFNPYRQMLDKKVQNTGTLSQGESKKFTYGKVDS